MVEETLRTFRTELVYLKKDLVEEVRKELGLSLSGFYRYCILRTLDSMSVLSTKVKEALTMKSEDYEGRTS